MKKAIIFGTYTICWAIFLAVKMNVLAVGMATLALIALVVIKDSD